MTEAVYREPVLPRALLVTACASAIIVLAVGIKGGSIDPWTLPQQDAASSTGYPPPFDSCGHMKRRLTHIEAEIRELKQLIKQNENAGFMTEDLEDELRMWEHKRDKTMRGLDKRCPGWQSGS